MKTARKATRSDDPRANKPARPRRSPDGPARAVRQRSGRGETRRDARRPHEPGAVRRAPQTAPVARPVDKPSRATSVTQARARAKARKAKAPKVVRPPLRERLRERLITRLAGVDLRPQALLARIPFVVLVIGALGIGLAITLWLSTDSAGRSYELGSAREVNDALAQQKEALERDVLQAESAPALAEAARNLGMIPSKDTAHLVQDPVGNWVVVGKPKPAEGASPPPLNSKLPDPRPPAPQVPDPRAQRPAGAEVPTRITVPGQPGQPGAPAGPGAEAALRLPPAAAVAGAVPAGPQAPAAVPAGPQAPLAPAAGPVPAPVQTPDPLTTLPPGLSLPVVEIPAVPPVAPVPAPPAAPGFPQ